MMRHASAPIVLAFLLAGCTTPADDAGVIQASLTVTSEDFSDGAELPDWATADALRGQCTGNNISPQLSWESTAEGTQAYALTMLDKDAGDFAHWMLANLPTDTTSVAHGASDALDGLGGKSSLSGAYDGTYFGPCPPGPDHHYVFTVYALDSPLDLEPGFTLSDLRHAMEGHVLAQGSLTGLRSGPA
jgi:Raf kinase inhibitor-like YbhB/YbcL family protein